MSARDAVIAEIKAAPESLVQEAYDFVLFLKHKSARDGESNGPPTAAPMPDFLARQKALFGNRVLSDSRAILDELRADRF